MASDSSTTALIVICGLIGVLFSLFLFWKVSQIEVRPSSRGYSALDERHDDNDGPSSGQKVYDIYAVIQRGANAFLFAEYSLCLVFLVVFGIVLMILTSKGPEGWDWSVGVHTSLAFVLGGLTSILSGYIGMSVAVYANARTTISAIQYGPDGWTGAFNTAFRAGGVMGFALCALALLVLFFLIHLYNAKYDFIANPSNAKALFECVAGYGLGGSSIALFGRVGGGIYTKAADVGADLAGKVVAGIPEDDPRNPAVIADNVGDNVGDVAGMGSDLFGSFAEATCAALVISATPNTDGTMDLPEAGWSAMMFPLAISAVGIVVCMLTSFIATDLQPVRAEVDVEKVLKVQLGVSALGMTIVLYPVASSFLPATFVVNDYELTAGAAYGCVLAGLWAGCLIGFITEVYTSHSYQPVRDVAYSCETGAATNIIYGLALGYKSVIIPISLISIVVFIDFSAGGMYGVALGALGMLSTLAICLAIDVYGPVCDNAGGIAEMAELPSDVRDKTDALDAAGNTTAAIGKGFAIGSAALVSLALFGAFVTRLGLSNIQVLRPIVFAGLFMGAMLPYWFTAMTMKSVGAAAMLMVQEVQNQFATITGLAEGAPGVQPDYERCIKISTDASLREMILPGLLVILSPILCGTFFGVEALSGLLVGALTSGVQLAISQSNTGGAWDNAKKYVEKGEVRLTDRDGVTQVHGKGSDVHKAAVVGDTVGDPLKDTSGPALNILMKLMAILSLVFADYFMSINNGQGVFNIATAD